MGGLIGDRLIVAVQAPAVDGKANDAVLKELAKTLGVRPRDIQIVFGELARDKRLIISGDESALSARLKELTDQPTLF